MDMIFLTFQILDSVRYCKDANTIHVSRQKHQYTNYGTPVPQKSMHWQPAIFKCACWHYMLGPETDQTLYQDDWRTCHYICLTYGKMQSFGLWSPIKYPREGCKPKIHLSWILRVLFTYWHTVAEMHCRWDIQTVIILILLSRNVLCILFVSQNIVQSRLFHLKSTLTSK